MATQRGPDGSVRLAISGTMSGISWANVGWVQTGNSSSMSQVDLDNLLGDWTSSFMTHFAPLQTTLAQYHLGTATGFYGGIHALHSTKILTGAGTNAGASIYDNSAAVVVSWNTSVYWRGGKPRMYVGAVPSSYVPDGRTITAAADTAYTTAGQAFHSDIGAFAIAGMQPITHGFVSFRSGNQPRLPPLFFPILGAVVHTRLGSQRRRLGKWTA